MRSILDLTSSRANGVRMSGAVLLAMVACLCACSRSQGNEPIKIGVIGEESSVAGASLTKAALLAAEDINANGAVNDRRVQVITYYNPPSPSEGVRSLHPPPTQH